MSFTVRKVTLPQTRTRVTGGVFAQTERGVEGQIGPACVWNYLEPIAEQLFLRARAPRHTNACAHSHTHTHTSTQ